MVADLSWLKELNADPKAIEQIEFVGQLKNLDDNNAVDADGRQSMFVLKILGKVKETILKFSRGNVTVLQKMESYEEAKVKIH